MDNRQRFEGSDLEDLLDKVRAEVGADAQIVAANRVRKGGLGGFFSREFFEVVVETPDAPPLATPAPPGGGAAGATTTGLPAGSRTVPLSTLRSRGTILDLAEHVNEVERGADPPIGGLDEIIDLRDERPPVSTETARFASILERIARDVDRIEGARPLPGEDGAEHDGPGGASPKAGSTSGPDTPGAHATASRAVSTALRPSDDAREVLDTGEGSPTARAAEAVEAALTGVRAASVERSPGAHHAGADPFGAKPCRPAVVRRRGGDAPDVIERPENRLARLGVPARLVPRGASPRELQGALVESLARLPAVLAPPRANGVVIAVVGIGSGPVRLARDLSEDFDHDPDRVVLATSDSLGDGIPSWLQITDAPTAEERRRSWHRRSHPTFVAVSIPGRTAGLDWAREILDHLEPTLVWAIVEAGWKCEDVEHWVEDLGGLDALAVTRTDDTVSPAAVLDLGIPVGRLEGRPATPLAWADLLVRRLGS